MSMVSIDAARVKAAVKWVDGVGAEYIQVRSVEGVVRAHAAVFVHAEVVLATGASEDFNVFLETKALQRFTAKVQKETVVLDIGDIVTLIDGKSKAKFAQPSAGRDCARIQPVNVVKTGLDTDSAKLLAKYTAREGKLSQAKFHDGWVYAHDKVAALCLPAEGDGYINRRVLEWGGDGAQYYTSPTGSYAREAEIEAVVYESHTPDVSGWPEQVPRVFEALENFQTGFALPVLDFRRALQAYGKLDVDQAIRISSEDGETAVLSIHGTKTVIEDALPVESSEPFTAVMAIATLMPFLAAAPDTVARVRYDENSPYLISADGWETRLLTPRGA